MRKRTLALFLPYFGVLLFTIALALTLPKRVVDLKNSYELYSSPPLSQLNTGLINVLLLGEKAVYDDFISIWLLQTLIDKTPGKDPVKLMAQIRSVIRHEPKLETTYMLACLVMVMDAKLCRILFDELSGPSGESFHDGRFP